MKTVNRWVLYLLGMLVLALGLTLNTKAGLGVSPIISIAFAVSEIWGWNFGDMTFLLYSIFVAGQFVLRRTRCVPKWRRQSPLPRRPRHRIRFPCISA